MPTVQEMSDFAQGLVRDAMEQMLEFVAADPPPYEDFVDAEMAAMSGDDGLRSDRMAAHFLLCRASEIIHPRDDTHEGPHPDDGYQMIGLGRHDEAMAVADSLLAEAASDEAGEPDADLVHHAHILRGKVHVERGDTTAAAAELLTAGDVGSSPVLGSFGPDLSLAWQLLRLGEDQAVLAYLRRVATFWSPCDPLGNRDDTDHGVGPA